MDNEVPPSGSSEIDFLKKQLENLNEDHEIDLSEYKYLFDDPNKVKKQTDAQYEIYINLTANVLEHIEGTEFPESKSVCVNNYFIPVPSGQSHHEYLKAFFDYVENCMSNSASQSTMEQKNE